MRATALSLTIGIAILGAAAGGATLGCGGSSPAPAKDPALAAAPARSRVVSWDLLAREPVANSAEVRHILIGWRDLAEAYNGGIDERAAARSQAEAEVVVEAVLAKLKGGATFESLMAEYSEDGGSAATGRSYQASPDAQLVLEFRQLSLRLSPGEYGVCQSNFGFHVITRVQ
ncbi:MAG: peptidylprolyl isomerase [Myxococcales bacterium]|jgi:NIMA-interacting peptidyl-prolyl cis-trans isomerase 1|nr:peptidylprolyl isomerase [Myxococcales bacterium]HRC55070.1 peptidylprolyl isomerase [Kofleriaceae bacterium]